MTKEIKVDILEKSGILRCNITIPAYNQHYRVNTKISTPHIKPYIEAQGYKLEEYELIEGGYVHNKGHPPVLQSSWVYKKIKKPVKRKPRASKATKNAKE
jgi:hypothetical protein